MAEKVKAYLQSAVAKVAKYNVNDRIVSINNCPGLIYISYIKKIKLITTQFLCAEYRE